MRVKYTKAKGDDIMAETKKKTTTTKKTTKPQESKTSTPKSSKATTAKSTTTTTKTTTTTTKKSSKRSGGLKTWGLNKISFWCIGAMAIFYLIASILSLCGITSKVIPALQGIATALGICIVAYVAWRYVKPKQTVWKVLYFVLLLVVILGIIIPLVK